MGTIIVSINPLKIDIPAHSFPLYSTIIGKVESIEVAPLETIPASLPKYLTNSGVITNVIKALNI